MNKTPINSSSHAVFFIVALLAAWAILLTVGILCVSPKHWPSALIFLSTIGSFIFLWTMAMVRSKHK